MATGISITPPSALTIGTTAISNGVEGRVLFQGAGDVLQQDAELFWDNVNKRLGVGATPDVNTRLDVRAQGALSTDIAFRVRNSADTQNLLQFSGNGNFSIGHVQSANAYISKGTASVVIYAGQYSNLNLPRTSASTPVILTTTSQGFRITSTTGEFRFSSTTYSTNFQIIRNVVNFSPVLSSNDLAAISNSNAIIIGNGTPPTTDYQDRFLLYSADRGGIDGKAAAHFRAEDGTVNVIGDFSGFGTDNPQARLDVRAQGALSTDIAFRVRNSADTADYYQLLGNGDHIVNSRMAGLSYLTMGSSVVDSASRLIINTGASTAHSFLSFSNNNGVRFSVTDKNYGFGVSPYTTGSNVLTIKSGAAPSTNITDAFGFYSADITAGNAAPHFRTENGDIIKLYRETTGIAAATFVSNTSLIVDDSATYGGYTMGQVVAALKAQGLLA